MADWCLQSNVIEPRSYFNQDEINELGKYVTTHMSTDYTKFSTSGNSSKKFVIKDVIFSPPATIVLWEDGTKTVVKCQNNETYSKEVGLAMCICKKAYGNKGNYNNVFKKFIKEYANAEN